MVSQGTFVLPDSNHPILDTYPSLPVPLGEEARGGQGQLRGQARNCSSLWGELFSTEPSSPCPPKPGERGCQSRGTWEQLGGRWSGRESQEPGKAHPATLLSKDLQLVRQEVTWRLSAHWEQGAMSSSWGGGTLSVREWGEKQCGGFRDRARLDPRVPPGSSSAPFAFFLQHIYKVIRNVHNQKTQRHRESMCPQEGRVTVREGCPFLCAPFPLCNAPASSTDAPSDSSRSLTGAEGRDGQTRILARAGRFK